MFREEAVHKNRLMQNAHLSGLTGIKRYPTSGSDAVQLIEIPVFGIRIPIPALTIC
jgi:hypothetical protein